MAAPEHFTIRNLTSHPITIITSSHFPKPGLDALVSKADALVSKAGKFTKLIVGRSQPSSAEIAAAAAKTAHTELNATIPAFTAVPIPLAIDESHTRRLDFTVPTSKTTTHKFRLEIPGSPKLELPVASLSGETEIKLTAIYHHSRKHVAILSSADLACWMSHLPDKTNLTSLSIPGTHNAPTYHRALPSVRCQAVPIRTQLVNGIRFLDIRVQPPTTGANTLSLVHGAFPVSLRGSRELTIAMQECYDFLAANPKETIIVSLKREGRCSTNDRLIRSRPGRSSTVHKRRQFGKLLSRIFTAIRSCQSPSN